MNNKTMLLILAIAAGYFLYKKTGVANAAAQNSAIPPVAAGIGSTYPSTGIRL